MTTLTLSPITSSTLSGLVAIPNIGGIGLEWDSVSDGLYQGTEIWRSLTNDRSAAELWGVVYNNAYIDTGCVTGTDYYYWIRSVDVYGRSTGGWHPSSSTGGVVASTTTVGTADIANTAVSIEKFNANTASNIFNAGGYGVAKSSRETLSLGMIEASGASSSGYVGEGSISSGTGISKASAEPGTGYDTWYDVMGSGYATITVNLRKVSVLSAWLDVDWDTVSVASGTVSIYAQLVLRNRTDSSDVKTIVVEVARIGTSGLVKSVPLVNLTGHNFGGTGFGYGTLIAANKSFDLRWRLKKTRTDASSTISMYWAKAALEFDCQE